MCLIMLCYAECVVQPISWLVNVHLLGAPRWLIGDGDRNLCMMTRNSEGRTSRLGQKVEGLSLGTCT
jgi:hypothetical protein